MNFLKISKYTYVDSLPDGWRCVVGALSLFESRRIYDDRHHGFFESIGLPGFLAWVVLIIEIATGVMLILGFRTLYAAIAAIPVLIGATWAHSADGWLFSSPGDGWEYPFFWMLVSLSIAFSEPQENSAPEYAPTAR